MSTLDEITKEKERIGETLARVDAQREKLITQLSELEATERVLARYGQGTRATKMGAAKISTAARKAPTPSRSRICASAPSASAPHGSTADAGRS